MLLVKELVERFCLERRYDYYIIEQVVATYCQSRDAYIYFATDNCSIYEVINNNSLVYSTTKSYVSDRLWSTGAVYCSDEAFTVIKMRRMMRY